MAVIVSSWHRVALLHIKLKYVAEDLQAVCCADLKQFIGTKKKRINAFLNVFSMEMQKVDNQKINLCG